MIYLTGTAFASDSSIRTSQLVQKVWSKVSNGTQLTWEVDGVWVYNHSSYSIFIKSATLENLDGIQDAVSTQSVPRFLHQGF